MRLTIVAATGRIGQHLHRQALRAGHGVTVLIRDPSRLILPAERIVTADLTAADPTELRTAVRDADAVLSCLGPRSLAEAGVTALATRAVTAAMRATGTTCAVASRFPATRDQGPFGQRWRERRGTKAATAT